jgi:hypothetical protein
MLAKSTLAGGLPLATGRFYPDFVAHLTDGGMLVVEYKSAQLHEPLKRDVGCCDKKHQVVMPCPMGCQK